MRIRMPAGRLAATAATAATAALALATVAIGLPAAHASDDPPGEEPESEFTVSLTSSATTTDFDHRSVDLAGTVTDADGTPVKDAPVQLSETVEFDTWNPWGDPIDPTERETLDLGTVHTDGQGSSRCRTWPRTAGRRRTASTSSPATGWCSRPRTTRATPTTATSSLTTPRSPSSRSPAPSTTRSTGPRCAPVTPSPSPARSPGPTATARSREPGCCCARTTRPRTTPDHDRRERRLHRQRHDPPRRQRLRDLLHAQGLLRRGREQGPPGRQHHP
ncbi:hypothetical protein NKH77_17430 [Streptomyces sp. M19]